MYISGGMHAHGMYNYPGGYKALLHVPKTLTQFLTVDIHGCIYFVSECRKKCLKEVSCLSCALAC